MDPRHPSHYTNPAIIIPSYDSSAPPVNGDPRARNSQPPHQYLTAPPVQPTHHPNQNYYLDAQYQQQAQWHAPVSSAQYQMAPAMPYSDPRNYPPQYQQQRPPPNQYHTARHAGMQSWQADAHARNAQHALPQSQPVEHLQAQFHMNHAHNRTLQSEVHQPQHRKPPEPEPDLEMSVKPVYMKKAVEQQQIDHSASMTPQNPPLNYRILLLSLADQYLSDAKRIAPQVAVLPKDQIAKGQYYDLVAAGLGCYEAVLANPAWNSSPRQEASIRLRLVSILHEETKQDAKVEEELSRGISKCERNRLFDLKYSMEHLLVRIMFKDQPKAALKRLDRIANEAKAYNHFAWVYALHFLRITLLTEQRQQPPADPKTLFASLRAITEMASQRRDYLVLTLAYIVEILVLQRSKGPDSASEIDRALASARGSLMSAGQEGMPQLEAMIHLVDLQSSLSPYDFKNAASKARALEAFFDQSVRKAKWPASGALSIALKATAAEAHTLDTAGIFQTRDDGRTMLSFQWLDKMETFALGYLLTSIQSLPDNARDTRTRTERTLKEALRALKEDDSGTFRSDSSSASSLGRLSARIHARQLMRCHIYTYLAMACTARSAYNEAANYVQQMENLRRTLGQDSPPNLAPFVDFIRAVLYHQNGNQAKALQCYQSPELTLDKATLVPASVRHELSVLSALGIILITHQPTHPSHRLAKECWNNLQETAFHMHEAGPTAINTGLNPQLIAACSLVMAATQKHRSAAGTDQKGITPTKRYIQLALQAAKRHSNYLILAAATSYGYQVLFHGQIGERALSTAVSAQQFADLSGSRMWQAVTDGLAARAHECAGDEGKASVAYNRGRATASELPRRIREGLGMGSAVKREE